MEGDLEKETPKPAVHFKVAFIAAIQSTRELFIIVAFAQETKGLLSSDQYDNISKLTSALTSSPSLQHGYRTRALFSRFQEALRLILERLPPHCKDPRGKALLSEQVLDKDIVNALGELDYDSLTFAVEHIRKCMFTLVKSVDIDVDFAQPASGSHLSKLSSSMQRLQRFSEHPMATRGEIEAGKQVTQQIRTMMDIDLPRLRDRVIPGAITNANELIAAVKGCAITEAMELKCVKFTNDDSGTEKVLDRVEGTIEQLEKIVAEGAKSASLPDFRKTAAVIYWDLPAESNTEKMVKGSVNNEIDLDADYGERSDELAIVNEILFKIYELKKVEPRDFSPGGQYRGVCRLFITFQHHISTNTTGKVKRASGTGWMISKDLILTAGHNVFNYPSYKTHAVAIGAYIGYTQDPSDKSNLALKTEFRSAKSIALHLGYYTCGQTKFDLAVIKLHSGFDDVQPMQVKTAPFSSGMASPSYVIAGYPKHLPENEGEGVRGHVMYHVKGDGIAYDGLDAPDIDYVLKYYLDTTNGMSGSPLLEMDPKTGNLEGIGVHCAGIPNSRSPNMASAIGHKGNDIEAFKEALRRGELGGYNMRRIIGPHGQRELDTWRVDVDLPVTP